MSLCFQRLRKLRVVPRQNLISPGEAFAERSADLDRMAVVGDDIALEERIGAGTRCYGVSLAIPKIDKGNVVYGVARLIQEVNRASSVVLWVAARGSKEIAGVLRVYSQYRPCVDDVSPIVD